MDTIFIDTSIYEKNRFVVGAELKTLMDAATKGYIRILFPELTEYEVMRHIEERALESNGRKQLEQLLDKSYLKHFGIRVWL